MHECSEVVHSTVAVLLRQMLNHQHTSLSYLGAVLAHSSGIDVRHNIDEIANRCSQTIGPITRIKYIIQTRIKMSLYNSIILPHTNYHLLV